MPKESISQLEQPGGQVITLPSLETAQECEEGVFLQTPFLRKYPLSQVMQPAESQALQLGSEQARQSVPLG